MESNPASRSYACIRWTLVIFIICAFGDVGTSSHFYFTTPVSIRSEHRTIQFGIPHTLVRGINYEKMTGLPSGAGLYLVPNFDNSNKLMESLNGQSTFPSYSKPPTFAYNKNLIRILNSRLNPNLGVEVPSEEEKNAELLEKEDSYIETFVNTVKRQTEHLMEPRSNVDLIPEPPSINATEPLGKDEEDLKLSETETSEAPVTKDSSEPEVSDETEIDINEKIDKELKNNEVGPPVPFSPSPILEDPNSNATEGVTLDALVSAFDAAATPKHATAADSEEASKMEFEDIVNTTPIPGLSSSTTEEDIPSPDPDSSFGKTSDENAPAPAESTMAPAEPESLENVTDSGDGVIHYRFIPKGTSPPESMPQVPLLVSSLAPATEELPEFVQIERPTGPSMTPQWKRVQMPLMNNTWLGELALKALDSTPKYQQVFAINIGTLLINLRNESESISIWKELSPTTSRFFQDPKTGESKTRIRMTLEDNPTASTSNPLEDSMPMPSSRLPSLEPIGPKSSIEVSLGPFDVRIPIQKKKKRRQPSSST